MGEPKGDDEVFCQSCGEIIKQKAEICPECGVRNSVTNETAQQTTTTSRSYETEPSDSWVTGLKISLVLWAVIGVLLLLISQIVGFGAGPGQLLGGIGLAVLLSLLQLVGWALLAVSMYGDVKYVNYHTDEWPLNGTLYIAGAILLPILTQIIGGLGMFFGVGGSLIAPLIPAVVIVMGFRHLRTRSRMLSPEEQ